MTARILNDTDASLIKQYVALMQTEGVTLDFSADAIDAIADFAVVNETMKTYFQAPYPARATVQVAALPRGAAVEIEAILAL